MMEMARAKKALDFFFEHSDVSTPLALSFWGGEPLLNFSLITELVDYARKKAGSRKISFSLPTNVTLLNREKLDFLLANEVSLSLSLDGLAPSQNRRALASGQPSFPLVLKALDLIHEYYGRNLPAVRKTVTPDNIEAMEKDTLFFLDQGFRHLAISPDMDVPWDSAALGLYAAGQKALGDRWLSQLEAGDAFYIRSWIDLWMLEDLAGKEDFAFRRFICGAGSSMVAVDIHGRLFPCHRMVFSGRESGRFQIGSIDQGFDLAARQLYLDVSSELAHDCRACGLEKICGLLCPASNAVLSASINRSGKPACDFYALGLAFLKSLDEKAAAFPAYQAFRSGLKKSAYWQGPDSLYGWYFWKALDSEAREGLESKTMAILESLKNKRKAYE